MAGGQRVDREKAPPRWQSPRIESRATQDEVKAAYRSALLKYYPDVNSAPNAQRLTAMLNDANNVLSNPASRRDYDNALAPGTPSQQQGESVTETWDLFTCDGCGKIDPHLRFATFFWVWSILIYTQMRGAEASFALPAPAGYAIRTALFSAFLGPCGGKAETHFQRFFIFWWYASLAQS